MRPLHTAGGLTVPVYVIVEGMRWITSPLATILNASTRVQHVLPELVQLL
jgi:hypothetical protein